MSTTLSNRIATPSRLVASSKSPGFVENPTVRDRVPAETANALQVRSGRPSAEELAAFEDSFKVPSDFSGVVPRSTARPSIIQYTSSPSDLGAIVSDLDFLRELPRTRPMVERVTDPAQIEAFWADVKP